MIGLSYLANKQTVARPLQFSFLLSILEMFALRTKLVTHFHLFECWLISGTQYMKDNIQGFALNTAEFEILSWSINSSVAQRFKKLKILPTKSHCTIPKNSHFLKDIITCVYSDIMLNSLNKQLAPHLLTEEQWSYCAIPSSIQAQESLIYKSYFL